MISVIDIGTNTIRAVKLDGFRELQNTSERSTILEHTENGILSEDGIADLTKKLEKLTDIIGIKPYAFATSAFRSLENGKQVCAHIKETLGIDIDVLSGQDEAECDYISMKCKLGDASGIGADLGGGSCQLFAFDENIIESCSLPIGVKRMQTRFVSGVIPNEAERKNISHYVKESIDFSHNANTLYIMGGTARAMLKLTRTLTGIEKSEFSVGEFKNIGNTALDNAFLPIIKTVLPKRYDSIGIGIDTICHIAESIGANKVQIVDCSVREGYIIKKQQKNP